MSIAFLTPVLAQNGAAVGLALIPSERRARVGDTFDREPEKYGRGAWTIIKRFDNEEATQIKALVALLGIEQMQDLFAVSVLEPVLG